MLVHVKKKKVIIPLVLLSVSLLFLSACSDQYDPNQVSIERVSPSHERELLAVHDESSRVSLDVHDQYPASLSSKDHCQTDCYYAKEGDTVYSVAVQFRKDYRDIAVWNHLSPDEPIPAGRVIYLNAHSARLSSATELSSKEEDVNTLTDDALYSRDIPQQHTAASTSVPSGQVVSSVKTSSLPTVSNVLVSSQTTKNNIPSVKKDVVLSNPLNKEAIVSSNHDKNQVTQHLPSALLKSKNDSQVLDNSRFQWPAIGEVTHLYGQGPQKEGVDIATIPGSAIYASATGRVVFAKKEVSRYGNLIIIKHDDEWVTAYSHLGDLLVKEGAQVDIGQKIAQSSQKKSAYIHFEIRHHGHPLDPVSIIMGGNPMS